MTKSKYKPILFSTPMVQAILKGTKSQTRRIIKPQPKEGYLPSIFKGNDMRYHLSSRKSATELEGREWKFYQKGDILWVRETWHRIFDAETDEFLKYGYKADHSTGIWSPSIHMPKEAARIFLKVINVRCERINEISCEDCKKEGVNYHNHENADVDDFLALEAFMELWDSINGKDSWQQNPYVWVYEFEKIEKPLDFI